MTANTTMYRALALAPLATLLVLWLWLLVAIGAFAGGPNGNGFGTDFAISLGGAQVVRDGGNPYDRAALLHTERQYLHRSGLSNAQLPPLNSYSHSVIRVGNPPIYFWALQPLTRFPFRPTALIWIGALYILIAAGFLGVLGYLGWRRRVLPTLLFLAMPQVLLGAYYGNVDCLIFAALGASLLLLRPRPVYAGALLGIGWLKPQVAIPLILLIIVFHPEFRNRLALGFALSTAFLGTLTIAAMGWQSLEQWTVGLLGYPRDMTIQPDIATLGGLYGPLVSAHVRLGIEVLAVVLAASCFLALWSRFRASRLVPDVAVAWLWIVLFLAVPFAHFHDEMLLAMPILALAGRDGEALVRPLPLAVLYLMYFSVVPLAIHPSGLNLLSVPLVAVAVCLAMAARAPKSVHARPAVSTRAAYSGG